MKKRLLNAGRGVVSLEGTQHGQANPCIAFHKSLFGFLPDSD
jgi:hypothetical protein